MVRGGELESKQKMKDQILILTNDSKPRLGGIAEYLHNLALVLAEHYSVRIVTTVAGAESCNRGLPFAYKEVAPWALRLSGGRGISGAVGAAAFRLGHWLGATQILKQMLRKRPTRFVLIGSFCPATYMWCHACQRLGVAYQVVAHGRELVKPLGRIGDAHRLKYLRGAARVYANSSDTAELIAGLGVPREKIEMLMPGIMPDQVNIPAPEKRAVLRGRLGFGNRQFILLLSRLMPRKGVDLAIEAWAALASDFPDVDLVIAGSGPEERHLRCLASQLGVDSRVRFLGAVDETTKFALLADCEMFVMPNRRLPTDVEGFGIVFLEAALCGKAAIGGQNGGVVDAIEDGATGLLIDTSNGAAPLGAALRSLLGDAERAAHMGQAGRERALDRFQWVHTTRALLTNVAASPPQIPHTRRRIFSRLIGKIPSCCAGTGESHQKLTIRADHNRDRIG
jgi:phosphatidylinositol alpha-1,6-mannosyltransferase